MVPHLGRNQEQKSSMSEPKPTAPNPLLKLVIEFGPLVAFFITQRTMDLNAP